MTVRTRDDGTTVDVEYAIEQRGYPSNNWDDAGEPTIIAIGDVFDCNTGESVDLTPAEVERFEQEIAAEIDEDGDAWDGLYDE